LSGTRFSTLYSVGINDPEGPENITTLITLKIITFLKRKDWMLIGQQTLIERCADFVIQKTLIVSKF
jgi:hypothetical protein